MKQFAVIVVLVWLLIPSLATADSTDWSYDLSGYGQMQFHSADPFFDQQGFSMRRLRPTVKAQYQERTEFVGEIQLGSAGGTKILKAYATYDLVDSALIIKAGQFANRIMFIEAPPNKKKFVLYSHTDFYVQDQYATGVAAGGHYKQFFWEVQLSNGSPSGTADNNQDKDVSLFLQLTPDSTRIIRGCIQHGQQPNGERTTAWMSWSRKQGRHWHTMAAIVQRMDLVTYGGAYYSTVYRVDSLIELVGKCQLTTTTDDLIMARGVTPRAGVDVTPGVVITKDIVSFKANAVIGTEKPRYVFELQFTF